MNIVKAFRFILRSGQIKKLYVAGILALCMITAFIQVSMNLILIPLIDRTIGVGAIETDCLFMYACAVFMYACFKNIRRLCISRICIDSENYLACAVVRKLGKISMKYFFRVGEGEVTGLLNTRIKAYRSFLSAHLENFLYEPFVFCFTFIAFCRLDLKIAMTMFIVIMVSSFMNLIFGEQIARSSAEVYAAGNAVQNYQKEIVEDYDNICMSGIRRHVLNMHQRKTAVLLEQENVLAKKEAWAYVPALLNEYFPTVVFLMFSAFWVCSGQMTYGTFVSMLAMISNVSLPITYYLRSFTRLKEQYPFMEAMESLFLEEEIAQGVCQEKEKVQSETIVSLQHVKFSYDMEKCVLGDVSIDVKKGEKLGIIGESGAGKSTILNLILGFLKPSGGSVLVFGEEAFHEQRIIWQKIAYVGNENYLLEGTVKYNITLKQSDHTAPEEERYWEICERLGIAEIAAEREDVAQFGSNLSGGQKLRICLARAIFKKAELLILDEPAASLDMETAAVVLEVLKELNVTVILTTHWMGLLEICDRVVRVDAGRFRVER